MKRSDLFFTALRIPIDVLMVVVAFLAAYYLRLSQGDFDAQVYWPIDQYLRFVGLLTPAWILIFALTGLYSLVRERSWAEFSRIFVGVSGGTFLVVAWPFLTRQEFFSRLVVIYVFIFAFVFVLIGRMFVRGIRTFLQQYGIAIQRVILFGDSEFAALFEETLTKNRGYQVVRRVTSLEELQRIPRSSYDELIETDPRLSQKIILALIDFADRHHLDFRFVPNMYTARATHVEPGTMAGIPTFKVRRTLLDGWGRIVKRTIDIYIAALGLVVLSPLLLLIGSFIRLTSSGPALFGQTRVGFGGKLFTLYKFRSMGLVFARQKSRAEELKDYQKIDPELVKQVSRHVFYQKADDDPRVTKFGKFLRKTNLDELPQLWNVLRGEMSLVGPRPLRDEEFQQVAQYEKNYYWVGYVKPGMTGLWQISGRSDLTDRERIQLDLDYVENWSFLRDLWIIWGTVWSAILTKGAR